MKKIFVLSRENIALAKAEVLAITKNKTGEIADNLLILDSDLEDIHARLAYTHKVYRFLFKSRSKEFEGIVKDYDWDSVYNENFCVRAHNTSQSTEKKLAGLIFGKLKNP